MAVSKKSIRLEEQLAVDIRRIAEELHQTDTQVIETALKYYRDYYYAANKATLFNDQVIAVVNAMVGKLQRDINARTNTVLSELAIQAATQTFILAENLEVNSAKLNEYRLRALDHLKTTSRVLRLDEVTNG